MNTRGPEGMGLGADFFRIKPVDFAVETARDLGEKAIKGLGNLIGIKEGVQEVDGVPTMGLRDTTQAILETVGELVGGKAEFLDEGSFTEDALSIAGDLADGVLTATQDAVNALFDLTPSRIAEIGIVAATEVFVALAEPFTQDDKGFKAGVKSLPEILASLPEILPIAVAGAVGGVLSEAEHRITQGRPVGEIVDDWIIRNSEPDQDDVGYASMGKDLADLVRHPLRSALEMTVRDGAMRRKYPFKMPVRTQSLTE